LLFVSHDREFVSTIATRVIELTSKGYIDFAGTYDEYLASAF
jgi:ATPase subunit of ABC transporter with duplicated ATPase domains